MNHLLLKMDKSKISIKRLAMWSLATHESFGGTWLSDYFTNHHKVDINQDNHINVNETGCPIIGADGNIFNIMGIASRTLKKCGMSEEFA